MADSTYGQSRQMRACPFCGKPVRIESTRCPFCRETIPQVRPQGRAYGPEGRAKIRRGLLYILLAAILHYFAAGYSGMHLPVAIPPFVTDYGTPALFVCGFGLSIYGVCLYIRS